VKTRIALVTLTVLASLQKDLSEHATTEGIMTATGYGIVMTRIALVTLIADAYPQNGPKEHARIEEIMTATG